MAQSNIARFLMVTATMTERISNLVVPLALEATAMRTAETTGLVARDRSGAVSMLIGASLRRGDVDSANGNSLPLTLTMPGIRTSTTATRTTTTRTTTTERVPSADGFERHHADFSFKELVQAYLDCRESKRNSTSALVFESNLERNLCQLNDELLDGSYRPGRSICFVITRPKPREVWAADFRDRIVHHLLYNRITEPWWMQLAEQILFHDPRADFELRGSPDLLQLVPKHKRLTSQPATHGLPIGNLSSQFFANVLLDALDQHIKHDLRCKHYVRYVDDMVLLHESPQWLNAAKADIEAWLPEHLGLSLNPSKTILQPVARGVDFVGQIIKPWHRVTRKRTVNEAMRRVREIGAADLYQTANSYFGLLRQAKSHHQRAKLSNVLRYRGHIISGDLTKTYRREAV